MKTVLLIDKNVEKAFRLTEGLDTRTFRVFSAENRLEAAQILGSHRIDLIVCDALTCDQDHQLRNLVQDYSCKTLTVSVPAKSLSGQDIEILIEVLTNISSIQKPFSQDKYLKRLEKSYPGITQVEKDSEGFVLLD